MPSRVPSESSKEMPMKSPRHVRKDPDFLNVEMKDQWCLSLERFVVC